MISLAASPPAVWKRSHRNAYTSCTEMSKDINDAVFDQAHLTVGVIDQVRSLYRMSPMLVNAAAAVSWRILALST